MQKKTFIILCGMDIIYGREILKKWSPPLIRFSWYVQTVYDYFIKTISRNLLITLPQTRQFGCGSESLDIILIICSSYLISRWHRGWALINWQESFAMIGQKFTCAYYTSFTRPRKDTEFEAWWCTPLFFLYEEFRSCQEEKILYFLG